MESERDRATESKAILLHICLLSLLLCAFLTYDQLPFGFYLFVRSIALNCIYPFSAVKPTSERLRKRSRLSFSHIRAHDPSVRTFRMLDLWTKPIAYGARAFKTLRQR